METRPKAICPREPKKIAQEQAVDSFLNRLVVRRSNVKKMMGMLKMQMKPMKPMMQMMGNLLEMSRQVLARKIS